MAEGVAVAGRGRGRGGRPPRAAPRELVVGQPATARAARVDPRARRPRRRAAPAGRRRQAPRPGPSGSRAESGRQRRRVVAGGEQLLGEERVALAARGARRDQSLGRRPSAEAAGRSRAVSPRAEAARARALDAPAAARARRATAAAGGGGAARRCGRWRARASRCAAQAAQRGRRADPASAVGPVQVLDHEQRGPRRLPGGPRKPRSSVQTRPEADASLCAARSLGAAARPPLRGRAAPARRAPARPASSKAGSEHAPEASQRRGDRRVGLLAGRRGPGTRRAARAPRDRRTRRWKHAQQPRLADARLAGRRRRRPPRRPSRPAEKAASRPSETPLRGRRTPGSRPAVAHRGHLEPVAGHGGRYMTKPLGPPAAWWRARSRWSRRTCPRPPRPRRQEAVLVLAHDLARAVPPPRSRRGSPPAGPRRRCRPPTARRCGGCARSARVR